MASRWPWSKVAPIGTTFRMAATTGDITTVAAGDSIFSMYWSNTAKRALILSFAWQVAYIVAFGSAQIIRHSLFKASSFTVADSGGTALTLTNPEGKVDSKEESGTGTQFTDIRIATTTGLTAGTRTLYTQPFVSRLAWATTTLGNGLLTALWKDDFGKLVSDTPVVLRANEGLCLVNDVLMGASGKFNVTVEVEWAELNQGVA